MKWVNIVQGKFWHCYFLLLVHGFHLQNALNAIDQTHCGSLSCTFPYCAHCRQSSSGIHQLLAVRVLLQAMERCICVAWCKSSQESCSFLVVALKGKHWYDGFRKCCSSAARRTQLKKPGLCVEDGAPHYKYGQSLDHKGKQSVPVESMLSIWMGPE